MPNIRYVEGHVTEVERYHIKYRDIVYYFDTHKDMEQTLSILKRIQNSDNEFRVCNTIFHKTSKGK